MPKAPPNRVRELREARGLSQIALASAAGLTRQSIGAIEAARATPAVDVALRIARALSCKVEDLFGGAASDATIVAEPTLDPVEGRVALAQIGGRWVSYPLAGGAMVSSADGLVAKRGRTRVSVEPLGSPDQKRDNVVLMGCALAMGVLADRLNGARSQHHHWWIASSSTKALDALVKRQTHVAGIHLVDGRTGESNVADVRRHLGADKVVLVTLARWEAGLLVAKDNPKRIKGAADLGRRGLRLVAREQGSGARRLLDRSLEEAGLTRDIAKSAPVRATGHLEVAHAISIGAADTGVATRDAAIGFDLDFIPLAEERYDLAILAESLEDPRIIRLLDAMTAASYRRELSSLGYDAACTGERIAQIEAA
ncbi:MAG: helix-turn-helix domain-containing protein [Polyangiaceae bacterium]|nr:helix-turn-helix domain-containing protein [Polyangiaceae bacterium]